MSITLHDRLLRALQLSHVQLDELRLKLRGAAEVTWLWIACDARTRVRVIPAFALGPRTPALAHPVVHPTPLRFGDYSELAKRLGLGGLPVFASDGLSLYFYALTAHFGHWVQATDPHRQHSQVAAGLLYAQLIKHDCRHRLASVEHRVCLGTGACKALSNRHTSCDRSSGWRAVRLNASAPVLSRAPPAPAGPATYPGKGG